jgi:DnaJ like chaperone protein
MHVLSVNDILEIPDYIVGIIFFAPIVIGLFVYLYVTRHARSWKKGIYPPNLKFTEDNLLEAYLSLGARMILIDYSSSKDKTLYINEYFKRYFPRANYNFGDSLLFSMKYPIQVETVCHWLNSQLIDEGKRSQVIYFLTGLAVVQGKVSTKELQFLSVINDLLQLDAKNLERIIATYNSYEQAREEKSKKNASRRRVNLEVEYLKVLGLEKDATVDAIKKAYRKLVKLHHPDVFANASNAQQKLAEEQFIKIQAAYDYLTEKMPVK